MTLTGFFLALGFTPKAMEFHTLDAYTLVVNSLLELQFQWFIGFQCVSAGEPGILQLETWQIK